jgi:hypothetical protein
MVVQGDFTVKLVHADTKLPFREHAKHGKVYVEAEKNAEYFISVQRTGTAVDKDLLLEFYADGTDLGYYTPYTRGVMEKNPHVHGLFSRANGVESEKALKFKKARSTAPSSEGGASSIRLHLGKVEIKVFEAIYDGDECFHDAAPEALAPASLDVSQSVIEREKVVRTQEGAIVETVGSYNPDDTQKKYKRGEMIDTVTLHYCCLPSLLKLGVV